MKYQTHYKQLERRTFTFTEAEVMAALRAKAESCTAGLLPVGAASATWTMDIELYEGDDYKPHVTLTQSFEYPAGTITAAASPSPTKDQP